MANAIFVRQPIVTERLNVSFGMRAALGITSLATIVIGVYPDTFYSGRELAARDRAGVACGGGGEVARA
jgi:hypothetical protein